MILGAGLAGRLTAWKLRHHNYSILLCETSDENDDLLKTKILQLKNLTYNLEVGIPWLHSISEELSELLDDLDLTQTLVNYQNGGTKYHLRGKDLSFGNNIADVYNIKVGS